MFCDAFHVISGLFAYQINLLISELVLECRIESRTHILNSRNHKRMRCHFHRAELLVNTVIDAIGHDIQYLVASLTNKPL